MGVSGVFLKKKEDVNIHDIVRDVKIAAEKAGLKSRVEMMLYNSKRGGVYTTANIANTYEDIPQAQQWLMYIYSDDDCIGEFDWMLKERDLIRSIIIEDFSGCEEILLEFLYQYLKLNPDDYFWDELDWYYAYEDIIKIRQKEFDPEWCYKKPH